MLYENKVSWRDTRGLQSSIGIGWTEINDSS